jgi:hypothetical protein
VQDGISVLAVGISSPSGKQTLVRTGLFAESLLPSASQLTYRYFNAAPDVGTVNITIPNVESAIGVRFGTFSNVRTLTRETRYDFLFVNPAAMPTAGDTLRFQNIPFLFGKAYTILLTGSRGSDSTKNKLNAVLVQEY